MLTLKEPIKLNIANGLGSAADSSFYERISGNYGVLAAQITPKELLFFLAASPELPEDLGGMTTIAVQNSVSDNRAVTLDVINNVVNRILLSQTNSFTYQDQVYIDTVLSKLGITDVSLFMKQVQKLSSEHTDITELLRLYRQEQRLRQEAFSEPPEQSGARSGAQASQEEPAGPSPRYYLHNEIYNRLDTKSIYDTVNAFQSEQSHYFGSFQRNELRTSEQLKVSNLLSLSELRQTLLNNEQLGLTHAVNHFELGDMLPPPANEEQVLSQAAAAALVSTVEHVLVQRLSRSEGGSLWLSLENSLGETIENTIARFQSFHSGDTIYLSPETDLSIEQSSHYKNELGSITRLVELHSQFPQADSRLLQELIFREQEQAPFFEGETAETPAASLPEAAALEQLREKSAQSLTQEIHEQIKNDFSRAETTNIQSTQTQYQILEEQQKKGEASHFEPPAPPLADIIHAVSDSEAPPELINQEVAEISRRNRERFQQLQGVRAEKIAESIPVPDTGRTMSDALRSLSSPEAVLKELFEKPAELSHREASLPPEAAAYLAGTDDATRSILERAMLFEQDPAASADGGTLRGANLGELNAIAMVHPPLPAEALSEARRIERETVKLTERADTILEQYAEVPARTISPQTAPAAMPKVPIIHRQEQTGFTDEIIERLEQQRSTQQTVKESTDVISHRDIHETEINDVTSQVVTQSTEDITQLVNRAISKQMNTISDKVYHQMEKRLQTERSRRGRY